MHRIFCELDIVIISAKIRLQSATVKYLRICLVNGILKAMF